MKRALGWVPDVPDLRDYTYCAKRATLPRSVDLRKKLPKVYDQGDLGSCTAQALAATYQWNCIQQKLDTSIPSRLFIYYYERLAEGTVSSDSGAMLRTGIKVLSKRGVCPEKFWPYDIRRFAARPSTQAISAAGGDRRIDRYERVPVTESSIKSVLASGELVVFGAALFESFDQIGSSGLVPMPTSRESMIGGHAMTIVGYNTKSKRFLVRNSWGASWGSKGYCWFPFSYILNTDLCDDFWTITYV